MSDRMVSYAQNAEDVLLARAFRGQSRGFWVDVGANDPSHDSVTRHFSELGWRGVNVEPQADYFAALERHRPGDRNLNVGLGEQPGHILFHRVTEAPGMSTFSVSRAAELAGMGYQIDVSEIEVRTLSQLFEDYAADCTVDFLKVDVEGFEQAVLGGFDIERWRPRVLVVESERAVATWESRFMEAGYTRTFWDGFNVYLVRNEDLEALGPPLSRPATVLDAYDPWRYVEAHARVERRLADTYRVELLQLAMQSETVAQEACRLLADVLAVRDDVIEHFGTPLEADLAKLLTWAGTAGLRPKEPHIDVLLPLADMFTSWARKLESVGDDASGSQLLTEARERKLDALVSSPAGPLLKVAYRLRERVRGA